VCEVVCYTEVRPGLSGKKMRCGTSASRDENGQMDVQCLGKRQSSK